MLDHLVNPDALYGMVVFDALIRTMDRHDRNVVALKVADEGPRYHLFLYDHGHAVV